MKSNATLKQVKYQSAMRSLTLKKLMIADGPDLNTRQHMALMNLLFCWDPASTTKYFHQTFEYGMTLTTLRNLGTERHQKYIKQTVAGEVSLIYICIITIFALFGNIVFNFTRTSDTLSFK